MSQGRFDPRALTGAHTIAHALFAAVCASVLIAAGAAYPVVHRHHVAAHTGQARQAAVARDELFTELAGHAALTDDPVGHLARDLRPLLAKPNPAKALSGFYLSTPAYPGIEDSLREALTVPTDVQAGDSGPLAPAFVVQLVQATPGTYRDLLVDPATLPAPRSVGLLSWTGYGLAIGAPVAAWLAWVGLLAAASTPVRALRARRRRRAQQATQAGLIAQQQAQRAAAGPEERELLDLVGRLETMPAGARRDQVLAKARAALTLAQSREATFAQIDDAERLEVMARRVGELDAATREGVEAYRRTQ